jgi:3-oxoacyl-[acyl-carrier protein] reductase
MQKVAMVTGASRGIGRAVAATLAQRGFVLVNYAGSVRDAEEAVAAIAGAGGAAVSFKADVSSPTEVAALFG